MVGFSFKVPIYLPSLIRVKLLRSDLLRDYRVPDLYPVFQNAASFVILFFFHSILGRTHQVDLYRPNKMFWRCQQHVSAGWRIRWSSYFDAVSTCQQHNRSSACSEDLRKAAKIRNKIVFCFKNLMSGICQNGSPTHFTVSSGYFLQALSQRKPLVQAVLKGLFAFLPRKNVLVRFLIL